MQREKRDEKRVKRLRNRISSCEWRKWRSVAVYKRTYRANLSKLETGSTVALLWFSAGSAAACYATNILCHLNEPLMEGSDSLVESRMMMKTDASGSCVCSCRSSERLVDASDESSVQASL